MHPVPIGLLFQTDQMSDSSKPRDILASHNKTYNILWTKAQQRTLASIVAELFFQQREHHELEQDFPGAGP